MINNIDATIIAQRPKVGPYREEMVRNIAKALKIEENLVNVKATTEEGLRFTGTGEGISSQAIASLSLATDYSVEVSPYSNCEGCGGCKKN